MHVCISLGCTSWPLLTYSIYNHNVKGYSKPISLIRLVMIIRGEIYLKMSGFTSSAPKCIDDIMSYQKCMKGFLVIYLKIIPSKAIFMQHSRYFLSYYHSLMSIVIDMVGLRLWLCHYLIMVLYILYHMALSLGSDHFIIGGGAGRLFFSADFFSVDVKAGRGFHTPFEARFFFTKN